MTYVELVTYLWFLTLLGVWITAEDYLNWELERVKSDR